MKNGKSPGTDCYTGNFLTIINRKLNQNIPIYELKDYNNEVIQGGFFMNLNYN